MDTDGSHSTRRRIENFIKKEIVMNRTICMELLAKRDFRAIRSILGVMNVVDIASLLFELEDKELVQAFRLIAKDKAADVFAYMNNSMQTKLV